MSAERKKLYVKARSDKIFLNSPPNMPLTACLPDHITHERDRKTAHIQQQQKNKHQNTSLIQLASVCVPSLLSTYLHLRSRLPDVLAYDRGTRCEQHSIKHLECVIREIENKV